MKKFLALLFLISLTFIMTITASATGNDSNSTSGLGISDQNLITIGIAVIGVITIVATIIFWVKHKNGRR